MFNVDSSWASKRVLFLDVATRSTGWAFYTDTNKPVLQYGAFQTDSKYVYVRLQRLNESMKALSQLLNPDLVVMEGGFAESKEKVNCPHCNTLIHGVVNFYDRSADVTMMLAEARGSAAAAFDCPIMKISNTEWKKAIGLNTKEKLKREVVKYEAYLAACQLWDTDITITFNKGKATYDESDACAALAYVLRDMRYD